MEFGKDKRLGMFYMNIPSEDKKEVFLKIMSMLEFIPYRADLHDDDKFRYIGTSPRFVNIKEGDSIPEYNIELINKDGEFTIVAEKQI